MMSILGVSFRPTTKERLLETITKHLDDHSFAEIFSFNPEILVTAQNNKQFRETLDNAELKIIDGVGLVLAGKILGISVGERITGADLMVDLLKIADEKNLKVLILGGFGSVAQDLSNKLKCKYRRAQFEGLIGYQSIKSPSSKEERKVQAVLKEFKPDLIFVAFGAPAQEFWVENHKQFLKHSVCMTVGGAVDFLAGKVNRAPLWMRKIGLEWLYRLIVQPWRWKRQLQLISFIKLVLREKLSQP
jgi:N-acetylglucosaminyldiphosphoundecaprenol N-acetyl-beta-D-mannosaminyltransferase